MHNTPNEELTPEQQQNLREQYEKGTEFLRMLSEFGYCLLFFSLFRITTMELFILLFNSLCFWIIYVGGREKSLCLLFIGAFLSLFWLIFFVFKLIRNTTLLVDPNLSIVFFVWLNILDIITLLVFFILIGMCMKGYIVVGFLLVVESDEDVRSRLLKKEEITKNNFGSIAENEENKINVNENK